ncbi:MAG: hypothetical protein BWY67_01082 [Bacteroidetes bacterium ADurb.Bin397]|jgi:four helix bundle protein|nr:MAG: hypothetical protein BWY67_01082 [Bacteroidetes bacterium ADurb.Bin397]
MESGFKELKVYILAYKLAMEIYNLSKSFPKEEKYALTDQIRRSSRSVCANIAEGYRKRLYPKHFVSKMSDSDCECSETLVWLDFSRDCEYLTSSKYQELCQQYSEVGRMLGFLINNPEKFAPRK